MFSQLVHYTITFAIIFTTLYSYGHFSSKIFEKKTDIFLKILFGYTLVGTITLISHFFYKINNEFSLSIIFFALVIFFFKRKLLFKKEFFIFFLLLIFLGPLFFGFSDHPIDTNMYHHPYVSYLKSEKIIFGIANIEFRFGHISFLQYVQAALTNEYLHDSSLASINIIFYIAFILSMYQKIISEKKFSLVFLIHILISCFILIKYARYREFGNDLIPLLVALYFFIWTFEEISKKKIKSQILYNLSLPFMAFMFMHKISFIFAAFIFLIFINYKTFRFWKYYNKFYFIFFVVIFISWLLKNYANTSCLAYPVEFTCISNQIFHLSGMANPSNASFLSEIWAKGFIDHPDWENLNLEIFVQDFNWVPTWINNHFIKILEIISPLIILIILSSIGLYRKKKYIEKKNFYSKNIINSFYILIYIFCGLFLWFYNAPVFRYGSFYIIAFIVTAYTLLISSFLKIKSFSNLRYFKNIFILCLFFFVFKNINRIYISENYFFPKTTVANVEKEFDRMNFNGLVLYRPNNLSVCYYTKFICSHELPNEINVKSINNYYILGYK
jgi:hypothetical protein